MKYRSLGKCGTKVSVLGLGGWLTYGNNVTDSTQVREILRTAFESGINFFDTADIYAKGAAEEIMGSTLSEFPRHELVLASKVYFPMSDDVNDRGLSRKHIRESIEKTLRRLKTDYLDLYFCHRFDDETPLEETIRAMSDLVTEGKILYWGTSEWSAAQLQTAASMAQTQGWYRPQVEQPQYNLLVRSKFENEIMPACRELGMGTVVWSPLASGLLTGKYDTGIPKGSRLDQNEWLRDKLFQEENLERVRKLERQASEMKCSRTQMALAWILAQPGVSSVITGATSMEQVRENVASLEVTLPDELNLMLNTLFSR